MVLVLPELAEVLVLFGALIFIYLVIYIAKAFFGVTGGVLGKLPVVGGWINSSLHSVEHKIVGAMQEAASGVDSAIGYSLHEIARLVDWMGREINAHASLIYTLGALALGPAFADATRSAIDRLAHHTDATARIARGIGEDVLPRVKHLEREYSHVIEPDIAALRRKARELEDGALDTFKWIRAHPLSLATATFAGAVAIALQRLGGSWIRCKNWNRIGKSVCGLPLGLIESLLGDVIDVLLIADICRITKLMISAAESSLVQGALRGIVDGMDDLLLCQGVDRPPGLAGYWTEPPPLQTFAALPG